MNRRKAVWNTNMMNYNVVMNLSSHRLTLPELSITKGLGFVPTHFKPKFQTINEDMLMFEHKLQLHYYFKNRQYDEEVEDEVITFAKPLLEGNSTWCPN